MEFYGAWNIDPRLMATDEEIHGQQYPTQPLSELSGHVPTHGGEYMSAHIDEPPHHTPIHDENDPFYPDPSSVPTRSFWEPAPQVSDELQHSSDTPVWPADAAVDIVLGNGNRLECLYSYNQDPWQVASRFCMKHGMEDRDIHDLAGQLSALRDKDWQIQQDLVPSLPRAPPRKMLKPRAPKKQKIPSKSAIDQTKLPKLPAPFSELATELKAPLFDIETWVRRSAPERHAEVGPARKVPRPMNSFMLYRKTYNAVNKKWCANTSNNQVISVVTGRSWNMESEKVQSRFRELARTESKGHEIAWPDYKYCPAQRDTKRKREEEDEGLSRGFSWSGGYPGRC